MAIIIKKHEHIQLMRIASQICKQTHELLQEMIKPGVTTGELSKAAYDYITKNDAKPSFLGYRGFPAPVCISINEEVIHGIPGSRRLIDGDIVSIDIGVCYNRFHGDAARTHAVGNISKRHRELIEVTEGCFFEGMKYAKQGHHLHEISNAMADYVTNAEFGLIQQWCGHGIGRKVHEDPQVPQTRQDNRGPALRYGMTLAIEPMVTAGNPDSHTKGDTWTICTVDKSYASHYENTVLITDEEPDILTL